MDHPKNFEAAACDPALEISQLGGGRPSPFSGRFDDLLEEAGGVRHAHGRREFEFAQWRAQKLDQSIRFEIRASNPFSFKHWGEVT
jgi:hypothetical protein